MHHLRTILKGVASLPFAAILADPLLAHAAAINLEKVSLVTAQGRVVAGKSFEAHWYEAEHAFANPSGGRYDEADTTLAWQRTLAFLKLHL